MATLASAILDIARLVTNVVDGVATGGSTTTIVDSAFPFQSVKRAIPADDHYNSGTIWFRSGNNSGVSAIVTDWAVVTGTATATFATQSGACAAGNLYSICDSKFPRYVLRQAVNYVLASIEGEDATNSTLTTVENQGSYTLPTGVYNVKAVRYGTSLTAPYDWQTLVGWYEQEGKIKLNAGVEISLTGYPIELTYRIPKTALSADTDALPNLLEPMWVAWAGAAYALRWRFPFDSTPSTASVLSEAIARAEREALRYYPKLHKQSQQDEASIWVR